MSFKNYFSFPTNYYIHYLSPKNYINFRKLYNKPFYITSSSLLSQLNFTFLSIIHDLLLFDVNESFINIYYCVYFIVGFSGYYS